MNETFQNGARDAFRYSGVLVLVLIVFVSILTLNAMKTFSYIGEETEAGETISVRGEGEIFAVPDIATFSYSVIEEGNTVAVAQEEAAAAWNDILEYLEGEGIAEADIKTIGFNISPVYAPMSDGVWVPDVDRDIVGYRVTQTAEVKIRDTAQVGEVLTGVGSRGVQNLSGISFTIDDDSEVQAQARAAAIADARENARELADALGVRLGDIVGFYESTNQPPYYPYGRDGSMSFDVAEESAFSAPQLPMGENRIFSQVEVTYEIR